MNSNIEEKFTKLVNGLFYGLMTLTVINTLVLWGMFYNEFYYHYDNLFMLFILCAIFLVVGVILCFLFKYVLLTFINISCNTQYTYNCLQRISRKLDKITENLESKPEN